MMSPIEIANSAAIPSAGIHQPTLGGHTMQASPIFKMSLASLAGRS